MTDIKRPISLQLNPTKPMNSTLSMPARPTSLTSPSSSKKVAIERPNQLTSSSSSGSISSLTSSTTLTSTTSTSSSSSLLLNRTPSPTTQTNGCHGLESPDSPSLILPYLYVGDQAQTRIDTISSLNISYILSLQSLPKFLDSDIQLEHNDELLSCDDQTGKDFQSAHKSQRQLARNLLPTLEDEDGDERSLDCGDCHNDDEEHSNYFRQHAEKFPPFADILADNSSIPLVTKVIKADDVKGEPQAKSSSYGCDTADMMETMTVSKDKSVAKNLLPSMNSSKDYLVKFRSCVNRLIRGKCINISDTFEQLVDKFFDETHNFIEEARRNRCNILVHCKAGISRSPTIAIAYLMKWKRLHFQDAYDFVKRCRPQISPNLNFMGQLMNYERRLLQKRFQKSPLPSPTTCFLLNHSYHDQLIATPQQHKQRRETQTAFTPEITRAEDDTKKTKDLNALTTNEYQVTSGNLDLNRQKNSTDWVGQSKSEIPIEFLNESDNH